MSKKNFRRKIGLAVKSDTSTNADNFVQTKICNDQVQKLTKRITNLCA